MSNFCQYCKVLQFDDSICGGHVGRSDTNEAVLCFADDQILKRDFWTGTKERILRLEYNRQDTLPNLPGLEETAAAGCHFCPFLRRSIQRRLRARPAPIAQDKLSISFVEYAWIVVDQGSKAGPSSWNLELSVIFELKKNGGQDRVKFDICSPQGPLATWLGISQMPRTSTDLTLEKVSWINDCISECVDCCHHRQFSDALPTRLIHVGDRAGNEFGNPRLVITAGQGASTEYFSTSHPKYAILSYCWGDSAASTLITKQTNLEDHLKEIRLEDMAPSCRDAILVTRAIGIEWLWIDALCILQDDKEDWEKEASRMAEAYGNAFLTIIPLRSHSSSESFLTQRRSNDYADIPFKSIINSTIDGTYTAWNYRYVANDLRDSLGFDIRASKWNSRGWTLQERMMSLRKLYFGDSGIYFACQNITKRENGTSKPHNHDSTGEWIHQNDLHRAWYEEIQSYTTMFLTFENDILPAVSAIASIISDRTGDDYVCGLWRSHLASELLWIVVRPPGELDHEEQMNRISSFEAYVGPSWSWTNPARNHLSPIWVFRNIAELTTKCDIIEAKSVVEGNNPFGCIQSAHILIKGRSRPLPGPNLYHMHRPGFPGQYWTVVEDGYFTAVCYLDWNVNESLAYVMKEGNENEEEKEGQGKEVDEKEYPRRRILTAASASWLNDLVMLLVGQDSQGKAMHGLLLVRAAKENEWYRVGVFLELSGEKEGKDPLQNWEKCTFKLV